MYRYLEKVRQHFRWWQADTRGVHHLNCAHIEWQQARVDFVVLSRAQSRQKLWWGGALSVTATMY
jgi:hypothetical protein